MGVYDKIIVYDKMLAGNIVLIKSMPQIKFDNSEYSVVVGIVNNIDNDKIILSNTAKIDSLEDNIQYHKSQIFRKVFLIEESFADIRPRRNGDLRLGDLLIVHKNSEQKRYVGFINTQGIDQIMLCNYHPNHRKPWLSKNKNEFIFDRKNSQDISYALLLPNHDIELATKWL